MPWPYLLSIGIVGAIFLYHVMAFELLPSYYSRKLSDAPRYEDPRAIRNLEQLAHLPAIGGQRLKQNVVFQLAHGYRLLRRYDDASRQYALLLQDADNWSFKATVHSRLAECMDGLKLPAQASEHRAQAMACFQTAFETATVCLERGKLLEVDHRYQDACEYYERGLPLSETNEIKNTLMAKLAIANFNAGNIAATVRWAEAAIENQATGATLTAMHSMAGVGHRNMGDLASAGVHYERLYKITSKENDPAKVAQAIAYLATLQAFEGNFEVALEMCGRARKACPEGNRIVGIIEYGILMLLGRFEEAKAALMNSRSADTLFIARAEDRSNGVYALGISEVAAETGNLAEAREFYEQGRRAFEGDSKMTVFADALGSWISALEGDKQEAQARIASVERNLGDCSGSRTTLLDVFALLTKATLEMGDYENALRYAKRYLEHKPYPAYCAVAYFLLGEAHLGLGETEKAIDAYERAIALNFPTRDAKRAQARLEELRRES